MSQVGPSELLQEILDRKASHGDATSNSVANPNDAAQASKLHLPSNDLKRLRYAHILNEFHRSLVENAGKLMLRGIFYQAKAIKYEGKPIFSKQREADNRVERVLSQLGITLQDAGVDSAARGLVAGEGERVRYRYEDGVEETVQWSSRRETLITNLERAEVELDDDVKAVIVVEKEVAFKQLMNPRFLDGASGDLGGKIVIITGKGYPDKKVQSLLFHVHKRYPAIPIFSIVDGDPSGYGILQGYADAADAQVEMIGVKSSLIFTLEPRYKESLIDKDVRKLENLLQRKDLCPSIKKEASRMLIYPFKAGIEALRSIEADLANWAAQHLNVLLQRRHPLAAAGQAHDPASLQLASTRNAVSRSSARRDRHNLGNRMSYQAKKARIADQSRQMEARRSQCDAIIVKPSMSDRPIIPRRRATSESPEETTSSLKKTAHVSLLEELSRKWEESRVANLNTIEHNSPQDLQVLTQALAMASSSTSTTTTPASSFTSGPSESSDAIPAATSSSSKKRKTTPAASSSSSSSSSSKKRKTTPPAAAAPSSSSSSSKKRKTTPSAAAAPSSPCSTTSNAPLQDTTNTSISKCAQCDKPTAGQTRQYDKANPGRRICRSCYDKTPRSNPSNKPCLGCSKTMAAGWNKAKDQPGEYRCHSCHKRFQRA